MRQLIAGNWKMNGLGASLAEIEIAAQSARGRIRAGGCPDLSAGDADRARRGRGRQGAIAIGGQDCHAEPSGAFTGDVSAEMLKDAGATTSSSGIPSAASIMARPMRWSRPRRAPPGVPA